MICKSVQIMTIYLNLEDKSFEELVLLLEVQNPHLEVLKNIQLLDKSHQC